ncbi:MAG: CocE/NonD family hydrolase [Proteobacteria bacterium]|nr:CocE/NonD family hydrolase [Pseudomonadota bacterium]
MRSSRSRFLALLTLILGLAAAAGAVEGDVAAHYLKNEYDIEMRDGVHLHTIVYTPKDSSRRYPILLRRTPYSVKPYGPGRFHDPKDLAPSEEFVTSGYIFVLQDVRGRFKSEGKWDNYRLRRHGRSGIDESTDTYDTIEWLLHHIKGHNGRVGQWGISHDGWMTVQSVMNPHPALKAASPQATTADAFFGDDFHDNGAFMTQILEWIYYMSESSNARGERAELPTPDLHYTTPWDYDFFLHAGPTDQINTKYFGGRLEKQWDEAIQHPDYDDYWRERNALEPLGNVRVPVLNVLGWYDTFDAYGSMATYLEIKKRNPRSVNTVVAGPWRHGGWLRDDGASLGDVKFGARTSDYYQKEVVFPFFQYYMKDEGNWSSPEAVMFETGRNAWHRFDQWPPKGVTHESVYLRANGALSMQKPTETDPTACDQYVSDPGKPVPYSTHISMENGNTWRIEDQRLISIRPDVLRYQSEPLTEDLTIAGASEVELFASTTGTDSDWVVKLIDIYPPDAAELPGYQRPVGMRLVRGRYRESFSKPAPLEPGEVTAYHIELLDKLHTFGKGHRIGIQVQSSFFPFIDRNPQTFVNIYRAKPTDYVPATQRVCHYAKAASRIVLPVIELARTR